MADYTGKVVKKVGLARLAKARSMSGSLNNLGRESNPENSSSDGSVCDIFPLVDASDVVSNVSDVSLNEFPNKIINSPSSVIPNPPNTVFVNSPQIPEIVLNCTEVPESVLILPSPNPEALSGSETSPVLKTHTEGDIIANDPKDVAVTAPQATTSQKPRVRNVPIELEEPIEKNQSATEVFFDVGPPDLPSEEDEETNADTEGISASPFKKSFLKSFHRRSSKKKKTQQPNEANQLGVPKVPKRSRSLSRLTDAFTQVHNVCLLPAAQSSADLEKRSPPSSRSTNELLVTSESFTNFKLFSPTLSSTAPELRLLSPKFAFDSPEYFLNSTLPSPDDYNDTPPLSELSFQDSSTRISESSSSFPESGSSFPEHSTSSSKLSSVGSNKSIPNDIQSSIQNSSSPQIKVNLSKLRSRPKKKNELTNCNRNRSMSVQANHSYDSLNSLVNNNENASKLKLYHRTLAKQMKPLKISEATDYSGHVVLSSRSSLSSTPIREESEELLTSRRSDGAKDGSGRHSTWYSFEKGIEGSSSQDDVSSEECDSRSPESEEVLGSLPTRRWSSLGQINTDRSSPMSTVRPSEARQKNYLFGGLGSLLGPTELERYFPDRKVTIFIATWNMNGKEPPTSLDDFLLPDDMETMPDMYVVGTQESDGDRTEWEVRLQTTIGPSHVLFSSTVLGILHLTVFLRRDLVWFCSVPEESYYSLRPGTYFKTKGAVAISFQFFGTKMLFVNTHLFAHEENLSQRLQNYKNIIQNLDLPRNLRSGKAHKSKDVTHRYDIVFWMGDLNFRLVGNREEILEKVKKASAHQMDMQELMQYDQLSQSKQAGHVFNGFDEGAIHFPPTFKFDVGTNHYDSSSKQRVPSYTDRILYKSTRDPIKCSSYSSCPLFKTSDHKPVCGVYQFKVRPGKDDVPLAAGLFQRDVYLTALKRRRRFFHQPSSKNCQMQ